jgi:CO/xanthine dehydrogenase Mo-binding subunit
MKTLREYINIIETDALAENAVTQFASAAHEEWRKNFDPSGTKSRIKKNSDGTEGDINVPFNKLHPDWKKENLAAGQAAAAAVSKFPDDIEKAAEYIHIEWMKRNPKADYNAAQHVPYDQLPEDEKEKDRVHVRTMMELLGK